MTPTSVQTLDRNEATMSNTVYISHKPMCDIHKYMLNDANVPAAYDGKTTDGRWANMCESCFEENGVGLGTGMGQKFIFGEPPEENPAEKRDEITQAIAEGRTDDVWDLVGDGDLLDFI